MGCNSPKPIALSCIRVVLMPLLSKEGGWKIETRYGAAEEQARAPDCRSGQVSAHRLRIRRLPASSRVAPAPDSRVAACSPAQPSPARPSPARPAHLALHLHSTQAAAARPVPVAAVHAERRALSRLIGPGRPSGARAAGPRSAVSGLGARPGASSRHLPRGRSRCAAQRRLLRCGRRV